MTKAAAKWEREFDEWAAASGKNGTKSPTYIKTAKAYLSYLGKKHGSISGLTRENVIAFFKMLELEGLPRVPHPNTGRTRARIPCGPSTLAGVWSRVQSCLNFHSPEPYKPHPATLGLSWHGTESRAENVELITDPDDIQRLAGTLPYPYKPLYLLQMDVPPRPGAFLKMKVGDVEFGKNDAYVTLHFSAKNVKIKKERWTTIQDPDAIRELHTWLGMLERRGEAAKTDWLWPSPKKPGQPLGVGAYTGQIQKAARKLGLEVKNERNRSNVGAYMTRHAGMTRLRAKPGLNDADIAYQVGLKPGSPMLENYSHLTNEERRDKWLKTNGNGKAPAPESVDDKDAEIAGLKAQIAAMKAQRAKDMSLMKDEMREFIKSQVFLEREVKNPPEKPESKE